LVMKRGRPATIDGHGLGGSFSTWAMMYGSESEMWLQVGILSMIAIIWSAVGEINVRSWKRLKSMSMFVVDMRVTPSCS
jgi:hypothetical protein